MPSIRLSNIAAGTANALDGLQFQDIPEPGALVTIYASTPVALERTINERAFNSGRDLGIWI